MNTNPKTAAPPSDNVHLIVAQDEDFVIEHHPEDWIAFILFWSLAIIVFLQFFTRYILNDSLAWTEEIARYGLMWLAFIGGAVVTRKKTHIAVELLGNLMKPGRLRTALFALVDIVTLTFMGLLAYFSISITERMQAQTMTVFDLPMSLVYGGVAFGCFLMVIRQAVTVWTHARQRWQRADDYTHQIPARLRAKPMLVLMLVFLTALLVGVPVFIALAGSSLIYTHFIAGIPDFIILHRMAGGLDSFPLLAVPFFILAGNLMNSAGITNRIYDFAVATLRLDARRPRPRQHLRLGDLCRHVGHRNRRRRRARHHRDQGDAGPRLRHRILGRRHRGVGDARPDHPAVVAVRDLRHDGQRLDRRAVSGGLHPRRGDDDLHDDLCLVLRAQATAWGRISAFAGSCWARPSSRRCRR